MWLPRKYRPGEFSPQEKPRQMGKEGYTINTSRGRFWLLSELRDLSGDGAGKKCRDPYVAHVTVLITLCCYHAVRDAREKREEN
jgi:hypothetical protein